MEDKCKGGLDRHFSYYLFENFDAEAEADTPLNPRNFLDSSVDDILSWTADTPARFRSYSEACKKFNNGIINKLMEGGILRKDNDILFFDTPVFLSEDAQPIISFFSDAASHFAAMIQEKKLKLYTLAQSLENGCLPQVNLYHIICGMCFDGLFLDRLSEIGILSAGRAHSSGLDYLSVIYEKDPALERFSDGLLCSYNRIQNDDCALQSFGDANGNRLDCYRFFRLKEKESLPPPFAPVEDALADLSEKELLLGASNILNGRAVDRRITQALESFGYLKNGQVCVPVFRKKDNYTILAVEAILEETLLQPVSELLSGMDSLKITPIFHRVAKDEIANECWHILFGSMNEVLVSSGVVAKPPFKPGEGRYLQCIELYH